MEITEPQHRPLPHDKRSLFVYFYYTYKPVQNTLEASHFMNTWYVYQRMRDLYKGNDYNVQDVEDFLKKAGYKLENMGNSDHDFRWLLKT